MCHYAGGGEDQWCGTEWDLTRMIRQLPHAFQDCVCEDLFLKGRQRLMDLMTVSVVNSLFFFLFFLHICIMDVNTLPMHFLSNTAAVWREKCWSSIFRIHIKHSNQLALYYYCFELLQKHHSENSPFGSCIYDFNYIFRAIWDQRVNRSNTYYASSRVPFQIHHTNAHLYEVVVGSVETILYSLGGKKEMFSTLLVRLLGSFFHRSW